MPTENRSSNTEMVSVPRALAERISNICMFTMYKEDWRALSEILAKPAQQRQGEPVAYAVFTDNGNIRIWSTNCAAVAIKVMREEGKQVVPLYAHSAPSATGEVERLRTELDLRTQEREKFLGWCRDARAESTKLRAQLAERDALLREVLVGLWPSTPLAIKINAALSASAEPSAPVEIDERALIELALSEYGKATGNHVLPGGFNDKQDAFVQGFLCRAAMERKPS